MTDNIDELLDEYWDRIKKGEELIGTIQADIKKKIKERDVILRQEVVNRITQATIKSPDYHYLNDSMTVNRLINALAREAN